jgi:hypothetical protein
MELRNVKKVEEIGSAEILNCYLEKGWYLIETGKRIYGSSNAYEQIVYFIVAWSKDENPIYPDYRNEDELFRAKNPHLYENVV